MFLFMSTSADSVVSRRLQETLRLFHISGVDEVQVLAATRVYPVNQIHDVNTVKIQI